MSDETRKLLAELLNRNDTYGNVGQALAAFQYRPQKAGDETTALGVGLGQALASGILGGLSRRRKASQQREVAAILPELTLDPFSVQRPEGLDADIYEALRQDAVLNQIAEQKAAREEQRKFDLELEKIAFGENLKGKTARDAALIGALFSDPRIAKSIGDNPSNAGRILAEAFSERPQGRTAALPSGADVVAEVTRSADPFEEAIANVAADPLSALIEEGATARPDLTAEQIRIYEEVFDKTGDDGMAEAAALDATKAQRSSQVDDLKKAQDIRNAALELASTLSGVESAIDEASLQGLPFQGAITAGARLINQATDGGLNEFLSNRAELNALRSRVTKLFRTVGEGSITETEVENFVTGLPSPDKSQAENRVAYARLVDWLERQKAYADTLEKRAIGRVTPMDELNLNTQRKTSSAAAPSMDMSQFSGLSRQEALKKAKEKGLIR